LRNLLLHYLLFPNILSLLKSKLFFCLLVCFLAGLRFELRASHLLGR
jgi:hypothetical protein